MMLAAGCLSEVRKRHEIEETDAKLLRIIQTRLFEWIRHPGITKSDTPEEAPFTIIARALHWIAYTWRSEDTRLWLQNAAESHRDPIMVFLLIRELVEGWKDHPVTRPWLLDYAREYKYHRVGEAAINALWRNWPDHPDTYALFKTIV